MLNTPDPKLKAVMEEVKAVLKKHDLCAVVVLSNPDAMEYLFELESTWTMFQWHPEQRFLMANTKDRPLSKEAKKKLIEDSLGTVMGFRDVLTNLNHNFEQVIEMCGEQVGPIEHYTRKVQ